eukprot:gene32230-41774_t
MRIENNGFIFFCSNACQSISAHTTQQSWMPYRDGELRVGDGASGSDQGSNILLQTLTFLSNSFLPSGDLTSDYYRYTLWRAMQRLVGATLSVFGTQALLLALGFKKSSIGLAAATTWVLKDALGKMARIFWASRNGRKFDCDAKKWRFRSSLLYAMGNGLEILTYMFPSLFLLIAAVANGLKQMAIYKSFSTKSDNIGDITAKGEAQIAVIDLLGMVIGIAVSRLIGTDRTKIVAVFLALTFVDLLCVFNEIQSIVLHKLFRNADLLALTRSQVEEGDRARGRAESVEEVGGGKASVNLTSAPVGGQVAPVSAVGKVAATLGRRWQSAMTLLQGQRGRAANATLLGLLGPLNVSRSELLFLPASQGESIIKTWGSLHLPLTDRSNESLGQVLDLFGGGSKVLVVFRARVLRSWWQAFAIKARINSAEILRIKDGVPVAIAPQILLHVDATHPDLFRGLVVVHRVLHELYSSSERVVGPSQAVAAMLRLIHRTVARRRERLAATLTSSSQIRVDDTASEIVVDDPTAPMIEIPKSDADTQTDYSDRVAEKASSLAVTPDQSESEIERRELSEEEEAQVLREVGLDSADLLKMIGRALDYERSCGSVLEETLTAAGWDMKRFVFGTIRARVEWR